MDIFKTDELFREGKVAMNIEWIGFAESSINPATSKVADKVAFAQAPGLKGPDGKLIRWANIGGQPFVIMTWATDLQVKEAVDFVKWWLSPEVQHMFAAAWRPERHQVGLQRSEIRDLSSVEPHLGAGPRLAEGHLAHSGVLRAAGAGPGAVRPGHHRPAGRQDDLDNIAAFQEELLTEAGHIEN